MQGVEEDVEVLKNDMDVSKIQLSLVEQDIHLLESSLENAHKQIDDLSDCVDEFIGSLWHVGNTVATDLHAVVIEMKKVQGEVHADHKRLLGKFIKLDEELEKVVDLAGQKINAKMKEISDDFLEMIELEEAKWGEMETRVQNLESALSVLTDLLVHNQTHLGELEDAVMVDSSDEDGEGNMVVSSSSSNLDPVENIVAIPIPAPSIVHNTLVLIETPEEFIPPSLHSTPSPPYIQAQEDPSHDGVPEYWADPEISL
jgi:chromosome segregation ATPase